LQAALARIQRWEATKPGQGEDPVQIKKDLQQCMQLNFSVFREGAAMAEGLAQLKEILQAALARIQRWEATKPGQGEDPVQIKKDLQQC
ncbi:hypothetical protein CQA20_29335, partial [Klebsiella pneumoniae]